MLPFPFSLVLVLSLCFFVFFYLQTGEAFVCSDVIWSKDYFRSRLLWHWWWIFFPFSFIFLDPPTYAESISGAVNIDDDDDDDNEPPGSNMGDLTYTPMYRYVYNYRPPPAYHEVRRTSWNVIHNSWSF